MNRDELIEDVARAIAAELGYEWDSLYENKSEWINDRGSRHDINTPFRPYFRDAARAVVAVTLEAAAKVVEHGVTWTPPLSPAGELASRETAYLLGKSVRSLLPSPPR